MSDCDGFLPMFLWWVMAMVALIGSRWLVGPMNVNGQMGNRERTVDVTYERDDITYGSLNRSQEEWRALNFSSGQLIKC
jgi:hypothetical protein